MHQQRKFIKTKIAVGYLSLIAVALFSVWFIYREIELLSSPDQSEIEFTLKRRAVNQTLTRLYQTEIIGQSLSAGQLKNYPLYKKAMAEVLTSIDSLKSFASDSLQYSRMDSISLLLQQKEINTMSLLKTISESKIDWLYRQNIDRIIKEQDSLITKQSIQRQFVVKQDSFKVKKQHKGFFKRLVSAFSPSKEDSSTVVNTSRQILTDTLVQAFNPVDTIVGIFKNIQSEVDDQQREMQELLTRKNNTLRYNNQVLNQKITQIIRDFEDQELSRSLNKLELQKELKQHSMKTIGTIAVSSIVLAMFFLILIWRDITKSNHYRKRLELANLKAEGLLESREKLMLTITHDIKAPLSSIMGYTELLTRLTTEERQRFYLNNMSSSSKHLLRLINDLLDFHRLDSNKMEVNRITFNPRQLFDEIAVSFAPIADKKNLRLKYHIIPNLDGHYISDPFRIRQIVNNLISNAIKFTDTGEVSLLVSWEKQELRMEVKDTGRGISEKDTERIFQEFIRLTDAQGAEGFGLGLSITRKLTTLLEGHMTLNSQIGIGSTFTVWLPLYPVAELPKEMPASLTTSLHCLLVDDDRIQLELTTAMLSSLGIKSTECQDPNQVLTLLLTQPFHLLLTDVQMPAMNGFQLLERIRYSGIPGTETLPIIAVTARSDMENTDFCEKGFNGCLHKPFSMKELLQVINKQTITESPLNFNHLTAFSENDAEAASAIIKTFITETKKNQNCLQAALNASDTDAIAALAHKLLPLFTLINATSCIPLLSQLEKGWDKQLTPQLQIQISSLLKEMNQIILQAEEKA